jgi:hypothetical protein
MLMGAPHPRELLTKRGSRRTKILKRVRRAVCCGAPGGGAGVGPGRGGRRRRSAGAGVRGSASGGRGEDPEEQHGWATGLILQVGCGCFAFQPGRRCLRAGKPCLSRHTRHSMSSIKCQRYDLLPGACCGGGAALQDAEVAEIRDILLVLIIAAEHYSLQTDGGEYTRLLTFCKRVCKFFNKCSDSGEAPSRARAKRQGQRSGRAFSSPA